MPTYNSIQDTPAYKEMLSKGNVTEGQRKAYEALATMQMRGPSDYLASTDQGNIYADPEIQNALNASEGAYDQNYINQLIAQRTAALGNPQQLASDTYSKYVGDAQNTVDWWNAHPNGWETGLWDLAPFAFAALAVGAAAGFGANAMSAAETASSSVAAGADIGSAVSGSIAGFPDLSAALQTLPEVVGEGAAGAGAAGAGVAGLYPGLQTVTVTGAAPGAAAAGLSPAAAGAVAAGGLAATAGALDGTAPANTVDVHAPRPTGGTTITPPVIPILGPGDLAPIDTPPFNPGMPDVNGAPSSPGTGIKIPSIPGGSNNGGTSIPSWLIPAGIGAALLPKLTEGMSDPTTNSAVGTSISKLNGQGDAEMADWNNWLYPQAKDALATNKAATDALVASSNANGARLEGLSSDLMGNWNSYMFPTISGALDKNRAATDAYLAQSNATGARIEGLGNDLMSNWNSYMFPTLQSALASNKAATDDFVRASGVNAGKLEGRGDEESQYASEFYNRNKNVYIPLADKIIADANKFSKEGYMEQQAGLTIGDMRAAYAADQAARAQQLAAYGLDPTSGRALALSRGADVTNTANTASAANKARMAAEEIWGKKQMDAMNTSGVLNANAATYNTLNQGAGNLYTSANTVRGQGVDATSKYFGNAANLAQTEAGTYGTAGNLFTNANTVRGQGVKATSDYFTNANDFGKTAANTYNTAGGLISNANSVRAQGTKATSDYVGNVSDVGKTASSIYGTANSAYTNAGNLGLGASKLDYDKYIAEMQGRGQLLGAGIAALTGNNPVGNAVSGVVNSAGGALNGLVNSAGSWIGNKLFNSGSSGIPVGTASGIIDNYLF